MSKVKIIIVTQTYPPRTGGMQSVMQGLAKKLSEFYQVIVLPDHLVPKKEKSKNSALEIKTFPLPKFLRNFYKKIYIKKVIRKDTLLICDSWKSVFAIPINIKNKIIVLAHGQEYLDPRKIEKINLALSRASILISNSSFTKNLAKNVLNGSKLKHIVIPPTYFMDKSPARFKKTKNIIPNLLTLTRIDIRKGITQTMEALSILKKQKKIKEFIWHIAGSGPELDNLKKLSHLLDLKKEIKFNGWVNDFEKNKLFKKSDIFVMPSYKYKRSIEGFGIVYVEAAKYGIPSICGKDSGASDFVKNNVSGWVVDPLDLNALKKVLIDAINFPSKSREKGKVSKNKYINNFNGHIAFQLFLDTIKKINR